MSADRVAALAEVLHEVFGDDGGAHASTQATTCRYCEDYAERLLAFPTMRDLLAEERARALREAGQMAERLRQSNPINGDCSNSTLTRLQNALIAQSESVRTAILAERNEIQARRDADYVRLCAENEIRRADREQP